MHLGNGAITPECALATGAVAAAGLGLAAALARRSSAGLALDGRRVAMTAALSAGVFAAQMVNFPVLPFSSAHLIGGVLLAWLLTPAVGALVMAAILLLQAVILGDGGLLALGPNIINMALLPAALVAVIRRYASCGEESPRGEMLKLASVSFVATLLAAALIVGQVALFRSPEQLAGLGTFAASMLLLHLWIGVVEAVVTVSLVSVLSVGASRVGELCQTRPWSRLWSWYQIGTVAGVAILLAAVVLPFASSMPDGYEAAAEHAGMATLTSDEPGVLAAVGQMNLDIQLRQQALVEQVADLCGSDTIAAVMATLICGAAAVAGMCLTATSRRADC